jgi:hypothetical protein
MLYPLSYERTIQEYTAVRALTVCACGAVTFELAEHVLCVLWRPGPRIGDLLNAGGDGPPVDAYLVQYEIIRRFGLDLHRRRSAAGKCFSLPVTMTWAPALIAAASTCRSAGSGSVSPSMRGSYPEIRQSLTA